MPFSTPGRSRRAGCGAPRPKRTRVAAANFGALALRAASAAGGSRHHRLHQRIVAVDHHHRLRGRRCAPWPRHRPAIVPCQSRWSCVTLSTVAASGSKPSTAVELEARQLQHPHLGQGCRLGRSGGIERPRQRVQQRRTDVAGSHHAPAGALHQQGGQRRGGGLAVGAGDGQQPGRIGALGLQVGQRLDEQLQLALHRDAARARQLPAARRCARRAAPGRGSSAPGARRRAAPRPARRRAARRRAPRPAQRLGLRRRLARVPHAHARAMARAPARHRQPGFTQAEHQHRGLVALGAACCHHRSFRLPGRPGTAAW